MDYFFDIPVYRLTKEKYEAEQKAHIESMMFETDASSPRGRYYRDQLWKRYGGPWQFNEIIGYIRLHFLGTQIEGEWWRVDAKRVTRTRKKLFLNEHWKVVYEEVISEGSTSIEINWLILFYLKRAQEDKNLKRFYVDTSVFERTGPHVDWEAVLDKSGDL